MIRLIKLVLIGPLVALVGTGIVLGAALTAAPEPLIEAIKGSALRLATMDLPALESPEDLGDALAEAAERIDLKTVVEAAWGDDRVGVTATLTADGGQAEVTVVAEGSQMAELSGFEIELPTKITTTLTAHLDP